MHLPKIVAHCYKMLHIGLVVEKSLYSAGLDQVLPRQASSPVFLDDAQIASEPGFKSLVNYLGSISPSGGLARRADISPSRIKPLLPDIFILELVRKDGEITDLTLRLMGTRLARFYGERTGQSVSTLENADVIKRVFMTAKECADKQKNIGITVAILAGDQQYLQASALYCPLVGNSGQIDQIIGLAINRSTID